MANYFVDHYDTEPQASVGEALELLETYIEGIDDAKTVIAFGVVPLGRDREKCVGYCLHIT
jgi:hypothetical protein